MTDVEIYNLSILKATNNASKIGYIYVPNIIGAKNPRDIYYVIFSHDFAKAFWGEEMVGDDGYGFFITVLSWKYHLKQMVLEEEPLKYLERFL